MKTHAQTPPQKQHRVQAPIRRRWHPVLRPRRRGAAGLRPHRLGASRPPRLPLANPRWADPSSLREAARSGPSSGPRRLRCEARVGGRTSAGQRTSMAARRSIGLAAEDRALGELPPLREDHQEQRRALRHGGSSLTLRRAHRLPARGGASTTTPPSRGSRTALSSRRSMPPPGRRSAPRCGTPPRNGRPARTPLLPASGS